MLKPLTTDQIKSWQHGRTMEEIKKAFFSCQCNICKGLVWFESKPPESPFAFHCPICGCDNKKCYSSAKFVNGSSFVTDSFADPKIIDKLLKRLESGL